MHYKQIILRSGATAFALLILCTALVLAFAPVVRADDAAPADPAPTSSDTPSDTSATPSDTPADTPSTDSSTTDTNSTDTGSLSAPATDTAADGTTTSSDAADSPVAADASTTDTTVSTGDAASGTDVNNQVNTNTTDSNAASTTVVDSNDATVDNTASSSADTGGNSASSGGGDAAISTGNAFSSANVINVINTNIINSTGLLAFLNAFSAAGYDLRNLGLSFFDTSSATSGCSLSSCGSSLTVSNSNTATVNNAVISRASTGDNSASGQGDASISTGDAAASANVVNVVNTNITNSHYLLLALNNFGDLGGDITLPGAAFFEQLMARGGVSGNLSVSNDNTASLNSTTTASAETGGNAATSTDGSAQVQTGSALSNATTFNQVNTNLTGGTTVFLLVNVFGSWSGNVQGLPAGLSWTQTPNGIAIVGGASGLSSLTGSSTDCGCNSSVDVSNTNTAQVNNDVEVYALTGQNHASSASGTAEVATGNAYASANVVNLVNTNVLGQNWILAIMNIFGNWSGDLAFGHPDLWIGAVAETSDPTQPGSQVTYHFTVSNRGDADATNVVLHALFNTHMLSFASGQDDAGASWDLGTIAAGATQDFSYNATAGDPGSGHLVAVPLSATVSENETDNNAADNTDSVSIAVGKVLPSYGNGTNIGLYHDAPHLQITKTESVDKAVAPASIDYKVVVSNPLSAGPAYHALLSDTLTDPSGAVVYKNAWDLDTVNPGDEITLTYSVEFSTSSTPGDYTDVSNVTGLQNYSELPYANDIPIVSATSTFELDAPPAPVSAAPLPSVCTPLINSYIIPGRNNNSGDVKALQYFLNTFEGDSLTVSGSYDAASVAAVKAFQQKYASEVLAPWGMTTPSGAVYFTTQKKINEENCAGNASFPLSTAQQAEIQHFHSKPSDLFGAAVSPKHFSSKAPAVVPPPETQLASPAISPVSVPKDADSILKDLFKRFTAFMAPPFARAATE